jgi:hypothetical protein
LNGIQLIGHRSKHSSVDLNTARLVETHWRPGLALLIGNPLSQSSCVSSLSFGFFGSTYRNSFLSLTSQMG